MAQFALWARPSGGSVQWETKSVPHIRLVALVPTWSHMGGLSKWPLTFILTESGQQDVKLALVICLISTLLLGILCPLQLYIFFCKL